jgi:alpha-beta hydrolase superfamily lysophospholipase
LGDLAAWFVDGTSETWVIIVHGRNASPREGLRILPTLVDLGLPSLLINYRNDEGAPASPDGFHRHGQTEWKDLEAAAAYALDRGAKGLILAGYSMGGAIVTNFLYQSSLEDTVRGVILDSPMLDFNATVDHGARQRGLVRFLTPIGKFIAGRRFGIDWQDLDYLTRADKLATPILLFHGDEDDIVPIMTSDTLARVRSDIVTYVRGEGVAHAASWNNDPAIYEAAVRDFILALAK